LGGKEVNQVNAVPDKNIGNNLILKTLLLLASPYCTRNWPICSNVVLLSAPVNLTESGILYPGGYGIYS
jgi:hypothetical protein